MSLRKTSRKPAKLGATRRKPSRKPSRKPAKLGAPRRKPSRKPAKLGAPRRKPSRKASRKPAKLDAPRRKPSRKPKSRKYRNYKTTSKQNKFRMKVTQVMRRLAGMKSLKEGNLMRRKVIEKNRKKDLKKKRSEYLERSARLPKNPMINIAGYLLPESVIVPPNHPTKIAVKRRSSSMNQLVSIVKNNKKVQVALPNYPVGSRIQLNKLMDRDYFNLLNPHQKQEFKRLLSLHYSYNKSGYDDSILFGTGPMAKTWSTDGKQLTKEQRKKIRADLLQERDNGDQRFTFPLPLRILNENYSIEENKRSKSYPRTFDGKIDKTDDIFWPITRTGVSRFLNRIATVEEIYNLGF